MELGNTTGRPYSYLYIMFHNSSEYMLPIHSMSMHNLYCKQKGKNYTIPVMSHSREQKGY